MWRPARETMSQSAEEIRRYVLAHPEASDNLLGVVTFWLERDPSVANLANVEAALAWLVDERLIESRTMPDGGVLYRSCVARQPS
jgi:hypothetical protein